MRTVSRRLSTRLRVRLLCCLTCTHRNAGFLRMQLLASFPLTAPGRPLLI